MAGAEVYINNVKNFIKTTPKKRLYVYLFVFVGVLGAAIISYSLTQKEDYHTLFSGLSMEDASNIVAKLKELKVPYKLGMEGTTVYVPKEKAYEIRLMLASQNALPGSGGIGFELFDKTNYGMTEFMQNVNYKRAIQGELSRTINQMPEVKASRVHIAIPEKTLYTEKEKLASASVFLRLKPGKTLSKEQIQGIVVLVAGSIEGLKPEQVTVIDSSGKILYKGGEPDSPIMVSGQQFELQRNVERRLEESIQSMLDRFLGANKSIVRATADLNLRKVEEVQEEYSPEKKAISNEKRAHEKSINKSVKASGVPGVASNVPGPQRNVKPEAPERSSEAEKEEAQISYEVSKTVKKIIEPFGDIKRLSLAIVVDGRYEKVKGKKQEELKYNPRSQKELGDIKDLVARAVGYDEERGDKIEVINMPFEMEGLNEERELMQKAEREELIRSLVIYGALALAALLLFVFVARPMLKKRKEEKAALPAETVRDVYIKEADEEAEALEGTKKAPSLGPMQDKALVSTIIKEWVRESQ
ncbi:MAG TPA: flagellar basal-body MS-ring/collar protein FliF [Syntrophorhabdales bacterium]|nr:flagellar basal-body MS-ring/collar protein FliF [Syntrophorhabdales bacterium]